MTKQRSISGGCLCGAVRFRLSSPMRDIIACHCTQCRKNSGHYLAATAVRLENFVLLEERGLRWFRSSKRAQRGFCGICGSTLFWRPDSNDRMSVFAGSLDDSSGLRLSAHIFAADKGDYYDIDEKETIPIHAQGGIRLEFPFNEND